MEKQIKQLLTKSRGWLYSRDGEIEVFTKMSDDGEIEWYRQGNREVNSKFVVEIIYEDEE